MFFETSNPYWEPSSRISSILYSFHLCRCDCSSFRRLILHINLIPLVLSSAEVDAKSKVTVLIMEGFRLSSSICQRLSVNLTSRLCCDIGHTFDIFYRIELRVKLTFSQSRINSFKRLVFKRN